MRSSAARGESTVERLAWSALILPVLLFGFGLSRFQAWLVDDAVISFGYARTLELTGRLAQAPGAPAVEAISNPAWTVLLAGLRWVGLFDRGHEWFGYADYVWVIRVLAVACFAGVVACFYRAARELAAVVPATFGALGAGSLLATSTPYVMWSASGLENPLYGLVVATLFLVAVRGVARDRLLSAGTAAAAGALVVAAAATRPDGIIFVTAYPVAALLLSRRRWPALLRAAAVYLVTVAVPVAALLAWRRATFGLWVPNTAVAKGQSGATVAGIAARTAELPTMLTWPVLALVIVMMVIGVVAVRHHRSAVAALAVGAVLWGLAILGFGVLIKDWLPEFRFGTPTIVLALACLSLAAALLLAALSVGGRRPAVLRTLLAAAVSAALVSSVMIGEPRLQQRLRALPISGCFVAERYGRVFNLYADRLAIPSGSTFLVPDIGGTIMTSRLRVVDLAGLADPTVARLRASNDLPALRDYLLDSLRPTFVHLHGSWRTGLPGDQRFRRDYLALGLDGDYVRKEVVTDRTRLDEVTNEALALLPRMNQRTRLMDCGALEPGQLPT